MRKGLYDWMYRNNRAPWDLGPRKELVEVICAKPASWPNWRSIGAVTEEAITSGLAPG